MRNIETGIGGKVVGSILLIIIVGSLLVFIGFLIYNAKTLEDLNQTYKPFKTRILLIHSIKDLLTSLPAIGIFASIICFTFFFSTGKFQVLKFIYSDISTPAFIIFIILLIFIASSEFLIKPYLARKMEHQKNLSKLIYVTYEKIRNDQLNKKYEDAFFALQIYEKINPNDPRIPPLKRELETLSQQNIKQKSIKKIEVVEYEPKRGLYINAKKEYERGNYYLSLYYIERALKLHRDNKEIRKFYSLVKRKVDSLLGGLTGEEKEYKKLVEKKERGINALDNKDYYTAYKIFKELHSKYPELEDIELYFKEAEKNLLKNDYYTSELEKISWMPGYTNIIFIDKSGHLNIAGKMIEWEGNYYFYNIKRFVLNSSSSKYTTWKYGKWINNRIKLKNKNILLKIPKEKIVYYSIDPYVEPYYLPIISDIKRSNEELNIYEMLKISEALKYSGANIHNKYEYLSEKTGILFAFYVLTLLGASLGWIKRCFHENLPKIRSLLFFILSPPVVYLIYKLYTGANQILIYLHRYVIRFFNINLIVYFLIIQGIVSIVVTFYYLTRKVEEI